MNPTIDRAAWLAERRLGIGGSDIASVFNLGYGCRRRLWYNKTGHAEDFPFDGNKLTRLGTHLEPLIAWMYQEETGRILTSVESKACESVPELRPNVDRLVSDSESLRGPGVVEIKALGRQSFYLAKRTGLAADYLLQLQAGIMSWGVAWGAFVFMNRDNGDLIYFDVDKSESLCSEIAIEVPKFWVLVDKGPAPDRLEPDDKRCQSCAWRTTCQGDVLVQIEPSSDFEPDDSLRPLASEWIERRALRDEAKSLFEESDEELKACIGARSTIDTGAGKFTYHGSPRKGYTVAATTVRTLRLIGGKK